ncbi:hypothetical protein [Micromonospora sp. NPDC048830]|uniref:hypothetical protein n=1 Tax=Micromonospora sp. NPDC048830 TaxID=3364257 RepID=UPI00372162D9
MAGLVAKCRRNGRSGSLVLDVVGCRVAEVVSFAADLLPAFGLPPDVPAPS